MREDKNGCPQEGIGFWSREHTKTSKSVSETLGKGKVESPGGPA